MLNNGDNGPSPNGFWLTKGGEDIDDDDDDDDDNDALLYMDTDSPILHILEVRGTCARREWAGT